MSKLSEDHLESLEHTLVAILGTLFGLKPILTLVGDGNFVVVLPSWPLVDWLTAGSLLALVFFKIINSLVMFYRKGASKFSYTATTLCLVRSRLPSMACSLPTASLPRPRYPPPCALVRGRPIRLALRAHRSAWFLPVSGSFMTPSSVTLPRVFAHNQSIKTCSLMSASDSLEVPSREEQQREANAAVTRRRFTWHAPGVAGPGIGTMVARPHPALAHFLQQQPHALQHLEELYNIHIISLFSSIVLTLSVLLAAISVYVRFGAASPVAELDSELRFVMGAFAAQLGCYLVEILSWLLDQNVPVLSAAAALAHLCSWVCYIALLVLIAKVTHLSAIHGIRDSFGKRY